jgi:hypothetical protein
MTPRNMQKYEKPPIFKEIMKTLLEIKQRMDTIQSDLTCIKTVVNNEKDYVVINENHMELDVPGPIRVGRAPLGRLRRPSNCTMQDQEIEMLELRIFYTSRTRIMQVFRMRHRILFVA